MDKTGIVILAAGRSSRLGRPKQLLSFQGKLLVRHIADEALAAGLERVVVVTGANAGETSEALQGLPVEIVFNPHWEEGMAISIFAGLSRMLNLYPTIPAVILSVCDQPFLTAEVLRALVDRKVQSEKGIVASFYRDTVGTPVLFTYPYLQALLKLTGDEGAKKLLLQYKNDLAVVAFPQGYVDIYRPEDYEGLTAQLPQ